MKLALCICIFLLFSLSTFSQFVNNENSYIIELKKHYSYVAAHHDFITYYQTSHFNSTELSIGRQCNGNKNWHQHYNFPINGLGFHYVDFQNQYLGKLYALFYYINLPLITKNRYSLSFNFSSGLAWHNEVFSEDQNHNNLLISTHLNGLFNAEFSNNFIISDKFILTSGLDFAHTSNGLIRYPNFGINMASIHVGLGYFVADKKPSIKKAGLKEFQKSNDLLLSFSAGYKDLFLDGKYNTFTFSADYGKHMGYKIRFGIGMDIYYDGSLEIKIRENDDLTNCIFNKTRYAIFVSNYLKFGHIAIITQPGIIIYSPTKAPYSGFQNIGFIYYLTPKLYSRVLLRSYRFTAEFIEWGISYKIGNTTKGFNFNE